MDSFVSEYSHIYDAFINNTESVQMEKYSEIATNILSS